MSTVEISCKLKNSKRSVQGLLTVDSAATTSGFIQLKQNWSYIIGSAKYLIINTDWPITVEITKSNDDVISWNIQRNFVFDTEVKEIHITSWTGDANVDIFYEGKPGIFFENETDPTAKLQIGQMGAVVLHEYVFTNSLLEFAKTTGSTLIYPYAYQRVAKIRGAMLTYPYAKYRLAQLSAVVLTGEQQTPPSSEWITFEPVYMESGIPDIGLDAPGYYAFPAGGPVAAATGMSNGLGNVYGLENVPANVSDFLGVVTESDPLGDGSGGSELSIQLLTSEGESIGNREVQLRNHGSWICGTSVAAMYNKDLSGSLSSKVEFKVSSEDAVRINTPGFVNEWTISLVDMEEDFPVNSQPGETIEANFGIMNMAATFLSEIQIRKVVLNGDGSIGIGSTEPSYSQQQFGLASLRFLKLVESPTIRFTLMIEGVNDDHKVTINGEEFEASEVSVVDNYMIFIVRDLGIDSSLNTLQPGDTVTIRLGGLPQDTLLVRYETTNGSEDLIPFFQDNYGSEFVVGPEGEYGQYGMFSPLLGGETIGSYQFTYVHPLLTATQVDSSSQTIINDLSLSGEAIPESNNLEIQLRAYPTAETDTAFAQRIRINGIDDTPNEIELTSSQVFFWSGTGSSLSDRRYGNTNTIVEIYGRIESDSIPLRGLWLDTAVSDDGNTVYASTPDNQPYAGCLYKSEDSGSTWTVVSSPAVSWQKITMSGDAQHIVLINEGVLRISHNSGSTWTNVLSSSIDPVAVDFRCANVAMSGDGQLLVAIMKSISDVAANVYVSEDGGSNWIKRQPLNSVGWGAVSVSTDGSTIYIGQFSHPTESDGAILRSDDSGDTWTEVTPSGLLDSSWSSIDCDDNGNIVYATRRATIGDDPGETPGLYKSINRGVDWMPFLADGIDTNVWSDIQVANDQHIAISAYGNLDEGYLFISHDNGTTWIKKAPTGVPSELGAYSSVSMSTNGQIIFTQLGTTSGSIYRSIDGGSTWSIVGPLA